MDYLRLLLGLGFYFVAWLTTSYLLYRRSDTTACNTPTIASITGLLWPMMVIIVVAVSPVAFVAWLVSRLPGKK